MGNSNSNHEKIKSIPIPVNFEIILLTFEIFKSTAGSPILSTTPYRTVEYRSVP
jgi:hypothetical protein